MNRIGRTERLAPWLVLAVGNPSRGDDALGPLLVERLRAAGVEAAGDVELMTDFQLQVEHALDLEGRRGVLFVDAAQAGWAEDAARPVSNDETSPPTDSARTSPDADAVSFVRRPGAALTRLEARPGHPVFSHALSAPAVLQVATTIGEPAPPAWQLAIEGSSFALGAPLSAPGAAHLDQAVALAWSWLRSCRAGTTLAAADA